MLAFDFSDTRYLVNNETRNYPFVLHFSKVEFSNDIYIYTNTMYMKHNVIPLRPYKIQILLNRVTVCNFSRPGYIIYMMISSHNVLFILLSLKEFEIRIHYVQFMRLAVSKILL